MTKVRRAGKVRRVGGGRGDEGVKTEGRELDALYGVPDAPRVCPPPPTFNAQPASYAKDHYPNPENGFEII